MQTVPEQLGSPDLLVVLESEEDWGGLEWWEILVTQVHMVTPVSRALPACPVLLESQDLQETRVLLELKAFKVTLEYIKLVIKYASVYKDQPERVENLVLMGSPVVLERQVGLGLLTLLVCKVSLVCLVV